MTRIEYVWRENDERDAYRLADAGLPDEFWRHCAAILGEGMPPAAGKFAIHGDVIEMGRSYAVTTRGGRRVASLGGSTFKRALAIHRERLTIAENAIREEREAARIVWSD